MELSKSYGCHIPLLDLGELIKEHIGDNRECDLKITILSVRSKDENSND